MAKEFQLELELIAKIDDLERGMKDAQHAVEKSSDKMEQATKDAAEKGMAPLLETVAKVAAVMWVAEGAIKGAAAAVYGMAGDTEAAVNAIKGLPIVGPIATAIFDFADALEYAGNEATDAREDVLQLSIAVGTLEKALASRETRLSDMAELARLQGKTDEQIAMARLNTKFKTIKEESELEVIAANEAYEVRKQSIKDSHLSQAETLKLEIEAMMAHQAALSEIKKKAALRNKITTLQQQEQIKIAEEKRLEEIAKRNEELNKQAEAHHDMMLSMAEEQKKKEEEAAKAIATAQAAQKKADEERAKANQEALEKHLDFVKKVHDMKMDMAKVRAEAEMDVAQATSTFSTAGGSFTTGASAELIEAKLLTKISTASKELLAQIVANTAQVAGGFF